MILKDDYALTTHEDENGAEYDVKVFFSYQPFEAETLEGPAVEARVDELEVIRNEPIYDVANWVEYDGYSDSELKDLAAEIHELINQEFIDNMGEE